MSRFDKSYDCQEKIEKAKKLIIIDRHEEANQLYQYVLDNWPQDKHAVWSKAGLARLNIALGDDPNAQAGIGSLIADFNDHPGLPEVVFVVGEQYYYKALYKKEPPTRY